MRPKVFHDCVEAFTVLLQKHDEAASSYGFEKYLNMQRNLKVLTA
jgi:hypothetical protein